MGSKKKYIILLVSLGLAVVSSVTVIGLLTSTVTISSSGNIETVNVEVFSDSACTQILTHIDWGNLDPGDTTNTYLYIKNTGTVPLTINLSQSGWNPIQTSNYISMDWNQEGRVLDPDEVTQAMLTLSVSNTITGITNFTFDIIIRGEG